MGAELIAAGAAAVLTGGAVLAKDSRERQRQASQQAAHESIQEKIRRSKASAELLKEKMAFDKQLQEQQDLLKKNQDAAEAAHQVAEEADLNKKKIEDRDTARERQKSRSVGAIGRSDTILTGPLGLTSEYSGRQRKTLLGL